ncbi:hypothetical protein RhiJN_03630 [Ceratobasidium sp. AG-Ba]|nr:hypothetical protein RhiJN_03630 [Ceratobasidium sp. AG-Ba]QRW04521.1 hypothetical protein RhiLY_03520 [Ceratobasidium sp. AG-Ba]
MESEANYVPPHLTIGDPNEGEETEDLDFQDDFLNGNWNAGARYTVCSVPGAKIALIYTRAYPPTLVKGACADAHKNVQLLTNDLGYAEGEIYVLADILDERGFIDPERSPTKDNIYLLEYSYIRYSILGFNSTVPPAWDFSLYQEGVRGKRSLPSSIPAESTDTTPSPILPHGSAQVRTENPALQGRNYLCLSHKVYPGPHAPTPEALLHGKSVSNSSSLIADSTDGHRYSTSDVYACSLRITDFEVKPFKRNCRVHVNTDSSPFEMAIWEVVLPGQVDR